MRKPPGVDRLERELKMLKELEMKSNDLWDVVLSNATAKAFCKRCSTEATYSGKPTEVNEALAKFKEIHQDCEAIRQQERAAAGRF